MPNQAANLSLSWKQEVNERVAAHKSRRSTPAAEPVPFPQAHPSNQRAAAAAARVAARFAKAPGYSDLLMSGARAAVRAAEAASRAALEAKAAAESMSKLAELEAQRTVEASAQPRFASEAEEVRTVEAVPAEIEAAEPAIAALPAPVPVRESARETGQPIHIADSRSYQVRWAPELPALKTEPVESHAQHDEWAEMDAWRQSRPLPAPVADDEEPLGDEESLGMVEAMQPIPANLIEFPREIVAPRKVRPRLAESTAAEEAEHQLSIWEVDPRSVSTEPAPAEPQPAAPAPAWTEAQWSGMKLDAQPRTACSPDLEAQLDAEEEEQRLRALAKPSAEPALLSLRLLAAVVDFTLTVAALLAVFYFASGHIRTLPPLRTVEVDCAVAFLAAAGIYMALFHFFACGTPGMRFARIALSTLDGKTPTRPQCIGRFVALLISVLPVGLGLVWAVFDEDRFCWHDRLSRTYLRKI